MTSAYTLNRIVYRYGEKTALSLERLTIEHEKTTALIGPNGSGKTTLLKLLAFLDRPTQGAILFFGAPVSKKNSAELRKRVGFLPQKAYLLRGSVQENIVIGLKLRGCPVDQRKAKAAAALERLDIPHLAGKNVAQLSGGERQKTALARTIALEPEVLILDEPFSFLDQTGARALEKMIESCRIPLIFSTHDRLQGQALADDSISLIDGRRIRTPLVNLFHGGVVDQKFVTGKLEIALPGHIREGRHLAIDPDEIVLSKRPFDSSIRNHYRGRIIAIAEEMGRVRITVDAGETFHAMITHQSLDELALRLGESVWVNFKSNTVTIF